MRDKKFHEGKTVEAWIVVVFEHKRRFDENKARNVVSLSCLRLAILSQSILS